MLRPDLFRQVLALAILAIAPAQAHALCIYKGVDNAKTTMSEEYHDAAYVVRAHVVSADYHWSDEDESWTKYELTVTDSFKGNISPKFTFFTFRNSGGFYMDGDSASPDMDGDYLLFLVPHPHPATLPPSARGSFWVNYNCGQSKRWSELSSAEVSKLRSLSGRPQ